ncbi:hypothetical protein ONE63_008064 [Megalurothrips usitatus]|uniref:Uncharacterized protein n=1 Tax=Megalurothrips usitatus TaxID=439358 RepID=A0AAV7XWK6_9NEOP|nr:hypothetical protein ONE63_008064 [Megalurothrips usitatus]
MYTVLGRACDVCTPGADNMFTSECQCVRADGVERGVLTVNRMLPGPSIQVCQGDRIVVDVKNHMEGMELTLHWHGLWQYGSQYSDGVPYVTQCPIHEGNTFRYQMEATNEGTHFWHAHTGLQKMDGLYGSLVVRQAPARDVHSSRYDFDLPHHVCLISDWIHELATERFPGRLEATECHARGQMPDTLLINGKGQYQVTAYNASVKPPLEVFEVTPGKRHRFRMINSMSSVCPMEIIVQGHNLTVIATDGEPVRPVVVNSIISYSGERYDFIITASLSPPAAYWIQARGLGECATHQVQQLAILRYAGAPEQPTTPAPTYSASLPPGIVLNPLDWHCNNSRAICVSQLRNAKTVTGLGRTPYRAIWLPFRFHVFSAPELFAPRTYNKYLVAVNGFHVASLVAGFSYASPPSPLLSQRNDIPPSQFCSPATNRNCSSVCPCTHVIDVPRQVLVEVIIIDEVSAPHLNHPFHLHGQVFYVVGMGCAPTSVRNVTAYVRDLQSRGRLIRQFVDPPAKDTIAVPNNGYVILRFVTDNPGYWMLHCHFLFHVPIGMVVVIHVGNDLLDLPPVPPRFPRCGNFEPPVLECANPYNQLLT